MTQSAVGYATQVSTYPFANWSSSRKDPSDWSTPPDESFPVHDEHAPALQELGSSNPASSPASRIVSSSATSIVSSPEGVLNVTLYDAMQVTRLWLVLSPKALFNEAVLSETELRELTACALDNPSNAVVAGTAAVTASAIVSSSTTNSLHKLPQEIDGKFAANDASHLEVCRALGEHGLAGSAKSIFCRKNNSELLKNGDAELFVYTGG